MCICGGLLSSLSVTDRCPASERVRVWLEMNGRGDSDHSAVYSRVNGTALRRNITICVTTLNAILSGKTKLVQ